MSIHLVLCDMVRAVSYYQEGRYSAEKAEELLLRHKQQANNYPLLYDKGIINRRYALCTKQIRKQNEQS